MRVYRSFLFLLFLSLANSLSRNYENSVYDRSPLREEREEPEGNEASDFDYQRSRKTEEANFGNRHSLRGYYRPNPAGQYRGVRGQKYYAYKEAPYEPSEDMRSRKALGKTGFEANQEFYEPSWRSAREEPYDYEDDVPALQESFQQNDRDEEAGYGDSGMSSAVRVEEGAKDKRDAEEKSAPAEEDESQESQKHSRALRGQVQDSDVDSSKSPESEQLGPADEAGEKDVQASRNARDSDAEEAKQESSSSDGGKQPGPAARTSRGAAQERPGPWSDEQRRELSQALDRVRGNDEQVAGLRRLLGDMGALGAGGAGGAAPAAKDKRSSKACGAEQANKKPDKSEQAAKMAAREKADEADESPRQKRQQGAPGARGFGEPPAGRRDGRERRAQRQLRAQIGALRADARRDAEDGRRNKRGLTTLLDVEDSRAGPAFEDSLKPLIRKRRSPEPEQGSQDGDPAAPQGALVARSGPGPAAAAAASDAQKELAKDHSEDVAKVKEAADGSSSKDQTKTNDELRSERDEGEERLSFDEQVEQRADDELQSQENEKLLLEPAYRGKEMVASAPPEAHVRVRRSGDLPETDEGQFERQKSHALPENQLVYRPFQAQQDSEYEEGVFEDDTDDGKGFVDKRQARYGPDFDRRPVHSRQFQADYEPSFGTETRDDGPRNLPDPGRSYSDGAVDHFDRKRRDQFSEMHVGGLISNRGSRKTKILDEQRAKRGDDYRQDDEKSEMNDEQNSVYFEPGAREYEGELTRNKRVKRE